MYHLVFPQRRRAVQYTMTRQFQATDQRLKRRLATVSLICVAGLATAAAWLTVRAPGRAASQDLLARYCVDCHNPAELTAGLVIDPKSLDAVGASAEHWEKVVRKLRAETMPPEDPRPAADAYVAAAAYLETELDDAAAANPQPGAVPPFRRLTRTEYRNAIRDLLGARPLPSELDFELLLPADNSAAASTTSPTCCSSRRSSWSATSRRRRRSRGSRSATCARPSW